MIEGLQVTVPGGELKELCLQRSVFHHARAAFYEQQKAALPEIDDEMVTQNLFNSKKQREMIQDRIDSHWADASEMEFIANHLDLTEKYLLDRGALARLGIVKAPHW